MSGPLTVSILHLGDTAVPPNPDNIWADFDVKPVGTRDTGVSPFVVIANMTIPDRPDASPTVGDANAAAWTRTLMAFARSSGCAVTMENALKQIIAAAWLNGHQSKQPAPKSA